MLGLPTPVGDEQRAAVSLLSVSEARPLVAHVCARLTPAAASAGVIVI
jgi:hypothetical protein